MARVVIDTAATQVTETEFPNNISSNTIYGSVSRMKSWAAAINAMTLELYAIYTPRRLTRAAAAALIIDPGTSFSTGDRIEYTDPLAGGSMGLVCITAGVGAGAVHREYGVIALT